MTDPTSLTITRKDLYERVWEESVAHLAPKLGIWPSRLANLCKRNRVPVPNRIYWQCSRADRKTMRTPLPDADQDWAINIVASQPGPPKPATDAQETSKIIVPERLSTRLHPLIRQAMQIDTHLSHEHGRLLHAKGVLNILVAEANLKRACRILDTLFKACETRGWKVHVEQGYRAKAIVTVEGLDIAVSLFEGLRQEPRELSEWERTSAIYRGYKRKPYNLCPNGQLRIRATGVECWWRRAEWGDKNRRRIEDMLDNILDDLGALPEIKRKEDQERAEAEARQREAERLRHEEAERQAAVHRERQRVIMEEQARVDKLLADAEDWDQSKKLRAYIAEYIAKARTSVKPGEQENSDDELDKWVAWAQSQADRLDPFTKIKGL